MKKYQVKATVKIVSNDKIDKTLTKAFKAVITHPIGASKYESVTKAMEEGGVSLLVALANHFDFKDLTEVTEADALGLDNTKHIYTGNYSGEDTKLAEKFFLITSTMRAGVDAEVATQWEDNDKQTHGESKVSYTCEFGNNVLLKKILSAQAVAEPERVSL